MIAEVLAYRYRAWRYRFKVEPPEINYVRSRLSSGDVAIDIGAHKGAFTYWMRERVGPEGHVHAFEPQPELADHLRKLCLRLGWSNVTVEALALSSREGDRALFVPRGGPAPGASLEALAAMETVDRIAVPVTTLDLYAKRHNIDRARLIKCDVEGHELDVFRGASELIAACRPILLFECEVRHHKGERIEHVFAHLESLGYKGAFFWDGALVPRDRFSAAAHQDPARKPYANNFVFAPEGKW
jgi:FkbM family methyltransferase